MLNVRRWSAESIDEKVSESLLRTRKIVGGINRAQNIIAGNLTVERSRQALETLIADGRIDISFFH